MINDELMLLVLDRRKFIIDLVISKKQVDIVNFVISKWECSSLDVAENFEISIQSASTQLKRLVDIGYLSRRETNHYSGGVEYLYRCRIRDRKPNTLSNSLPPKQAEGIKLP